VSGDADPVQEAPRMTLRRLQLSLAVLVATAGLLVGGLGYAGAGRSAGIREGGTFKVSFDKDNFDYVDPALSSGNAVLDATCTHLMSYPDKPPPDGLKLVPEVAAAYPRVSPDGRTYTFTLRPGFRFSDGTPVRASAFAHAIDRALAAARRGLTDPQYLRDIVGAGAVLSGKATSTAGVTASGNRLVVRLTQPAPDFPARTTMSFYCAVPPTLPSDPEGVGAFPGSGPYYVSEYVRGKRVVLGRNRFYGGTRPHHVDRFVVDLGVGTAGEVLERIERGQADWGSMAPVFYFDPARGLIRKYGINRSQFFVKPGLISRGYILNSSRPLFRNNLALRRAVNFAVDRPALAREAHGRPADQYQPPSMPGFKDANIYPLDGPDLAKARALARRHTRAGKAVLWTYDFPPAIASAQIVKQNLKAIGLDVEVKGLPPQAFYRQAALPGARFDIARSGWIASYIDPSEYANSLFDSQFIGTNNIGRFNSRKWDTAMRHAARLKGEARYRAYGELDVQLARDAAPRVQISFDSEPTLVSKRVGCIVLRPTLDLTAACLK
jgi:ABC-type oligopeptide transport system substrate-binding subunit